MTDFSKGLRDGVPIGLGYISVAFTFGMMAVGHGLSVLQAAIISLTNVTSAGQVAGLNLMFAGSGLFEMALTQFIINLRYALMSLSMTQKLASDMTVPRRALFSLCQTDEVFAVASGQKGLLNHRYLYGLMTAPYLGWALGTVAGAAAGTLLPEVVRSALGVAIYGMFIAIVIPPARRGAPVRLAAGIAAVLSCVMYYTPVLKNISSGFSIIICAVAASAYCAWRYPIDGGEEAASS